MSSDASASFHSRFNRFLAICLWLLSAVTVVAVLVTGSASVFYLLPFMAAVSVAAWLALWRTAVLIDDSSVELRNGLSTVIVPWAALIQVDTRFALTLVTPHGSFTSTAAPAPSRLTTMLSKRDADSVGRDVAVGGRIRPGDIPTTDSGAAAIIVRNRWKQLLDEGRVQLGVADQTPVVRHWHWPSITIVSALLLLTVAVAATT